jgi:hypothetical protein
MAPRACHGAWEFQSAGSDPILRVEPAFPPFARHPFRANKRDISGRELTPDEKLNGTTQWIIYGGLISDQPSTPRLEKCSGLHQQSSLVRFRIIK